MFILENLTIFLESSIKNRLRSVTNMVTLFQNSLAGISKMFFNWPEMADCTETMFYIRYKSDSSYERVYVHMSL